MAEQQKRDSSSKEKKSVLDLDIGKDFLSSWKAISIAEGDEMDFDLTPGPGNNKSFKFDKADIDFNLDGDFGKLSSFKMDMSDLDISPSLKKDEKTKEKPKESSSNRENKGKADRFTFAFDFDELDSFNFEPNLTKDSSKAENYNNKNENSESGSGFQDEEGSMHKKHNGSKIVSEDDPPKPSLNGTVMTLDMDSPVGGDADLEPIKENHLSNFAVNDDFTSEHSAAIREVASNKATSDVDTTIAPMELPKVGPSEKLVSAKPVEEACTGNDDAVDTPSDSPFRNEPNAGHSPEEHDEVNSMSTKTPTSNGKYNFNPLSVNSSSCHYKHAIAGNSHSLQTVEIAGENNCKKSEVVVESSVTTSAAQGILGDKTCTRDNNELALEILKLPSVSQTADLSDKETTKGREASAPCSKSFIQSEKPGCVAPDVSNQTTFSSLSSRKMGFIRPSIIERKRESVVGIDGYTKIAPLPLQYSELMKTKLKELPKILKQESYVAPKVPSADGLQKGKKLNDSSTAQGKETEPMKLVLGQREKSVKDLNALRSSCLSFSLEVNKNASHKGGNPTSLAAIQISNKSIPVEGHNKLFSIERGRKTPDPLGVKLQCLNFESTKSPIWKDINPVGSIGQNKVLLRKPTFDIAPSSNSQKQILTTDPSTKRKTPEGVSTNVIALHPSKRLIQSPTAGRKDVDTSEKILDRKVPSHSNMENKNTESTTINTHLSTLQIPHEATVKKVNMPFSIESNNNIKQAEAYAKELDDLCNMLRKKHDEAKELLVHAVVNNNKLLLLNNPLLYEKISFSVVFSNLFFHITYNSKNVDLYHYKHSCNSEYFFQINTEQKSWMKSVIHKKVKLAVAFPSMMQEIFTLSPTHFQEFEHS